MKHKQNFKAHLEQVLIENLNDDDFGISKICKKLGLSRMHLHRKVKEIDKTSTSIFIRNFRLEKSKQLIKYSNKNIGQIAFEVGFKDPAYFCRCFKERHQVTPGALRKLSAAQEA